MRDYVWKTCLQFDGFLSKKFSVDEQMSFVFQRSEIEVVI